MGRMKEELAKLQRTLDEAKVQMKSAGREGCT
jgi:hypothetical protein